MFTTNEWGSEQTRSQGDQNELRIFNKMFRRSDKDAKVSLCLLLAVVGRIYMPVGDLVDFLRVW